MSFITPINLFVHLESWRNGGVQISLRDIVELVEEIKLYALFTLPFLVLLVPVFCLI